MTHAVVRPVLSCIQKTPGTTPVGKEGMSVPRPPNSLGVCVECLELHICCGNVYHTQHKVLYPGNQRQALVLQKNW